MIGETHEAETVDSHVRNVEGYGCENAGGGVLLTTEAKIKEFASFHSDGIEEADEVEKVLKELLLVIISYCSGAVSLHHCKFSKKVGAVDVGAVPAIEECLSICIKTAEGKFKKCFECGLSKDDVEESFSKMLEGGKAQG